MSALEDAVEDLKKRFRREARDRRLSDGLRRSARASEGKPYPTTKDVK